MTGGITTAAVCRKSGKLPVGGLCDSDPGGSQVKTEYFAEGTVPGSACDVHTSVQVCEDTKLLPNETCEKTSLVCRVRPMDVKGGAAIGSTADSEYAPPTETCTKNHDAEKVEKEEIIQLPNGTWVKRTTYKDGHTEDEPVEPPTDKPTKPTKPTDPVTEPTDPTDPTDDSSSEDDG